MKNWIVSISCMLALAACNQSSTKIETSDSASLSAADVQDVLRLQLTSSATEVTLDGTITLTATP